MPRSGQPVQGLAQVLADHAFDLVGVGDHFFQTAVLLKPLHGGFGADFGDAGHVVHGVTHQVLVVEHEVRGHAELFQHPGHVAPLAVHGVDDGDALIHQLRQIFVATADHHLHAALGRQHGQGADHVVRLYPRHVQYPHAQQVHDFMDGRNLQAQIVGHGGPLRFVLGVNRITKGRALGVKHAGHISSRHFFFEGLHHVDHAAHRPGGAAAGVTRHGPQVGHGVESAVQVA